MNRLLSLCGLVCWLIGLYSFFVLTIGYSHGPSDFVQDYAAGHALRHGKPIYGEEIALYTLNLLGFSGHLNFHPPLSAAYFWPVSLLSYPTAFILWSRLSLFLFAWICLVSTRMFPLAIPPFALLGFGLVWPPFIFGIEMGQLSFVIAASIIGSWLALQRKADFAAGALLGFATTIKLFPGLLAVYLLLSKNWRALIGMLSAIGLCAARNVSLVGFEQCWYYLKTIIPLDVVEWSMYPLNISLLGVFLPLLTPNKYIEPFIELPFATAATIIKVLQLGLLCVLIIRSKRLIALGQTDQVFGLFLAAMILLSPLSWLHILVVLIPVLTSLTARFSSGFEKTVVYGVIGLLSAPQLLLIKAAISAYAPNPVAAPVYLMLSFPTLGVLLILLLCLKSPKRRAETPVVIPVSPRHNTAVL